MEEGREGSARAGLEQLDGYPEGLRLRERTLVIFDRRPSKRRGAGKGGAGKARLALAKAPSGRKVALLRL